MITFNPSYTMTKASNQTRIEAIRAKEAKAIKARLNKEYGIKEETNKGG